MEQVNLPNLLLRLTCSANFGRWCTTVKYISMSDTHAVESRSFRGGSSLSDGILGIYCHILTPRALSFHRYPLHLSHSLFSHCLRSCWMSFIYFPFFYPPPLSLLLTFGVILVLLALSSFCFTLPFDCWADCRPGVGGWSNCYTLAVCPRLRRLSWQRRRWRISLLQDYRVLCHCKCHSGRSASHYRLGMRVWDLLRDVKEVFHHVNHSGFCLSAWQPSLDV